MGNRRRARECALQIMYEMDLSSSSVENAMRNYFGVHEQLEEVEAYSRDLVAGVFKNRAEIDALIAKQSAHWKLERMALIDRNVLRIAVFELLKREDIPLRVVLNEAIEIGKRFGTEDSGAFINGILDHLAKNIGRL